MASAAWVFNDGERLDLMFSQNCPAGGVFGGKVVRGWCFRKAARFSHVHYIGQGGTEHALAMKHSPAFAIPGDYIEDRILDG